MPESGVTAPLKMTPQFWALISAHGVSSYGNYLNLIALGLFSYEVTETAFGVGAVMALRLCCGFLGGLVVAPLLAALSHRTVMIGSDVVQGIAMAILALSATRTPLWLLAGAVALLGTGNTFFTVALSSAIPAMVGQSARGRANGLLVTSRSLATVAGFASAAPVIAFGGYALAFAFNAMSFAVSAVTLLTLRRNWFGASPHVQTDVDAGPQEQTRERRRIRSSSRITSADLWREAASLPPLLLGMILLRGLDAFASASHNVALPVAAHSAASGEPAAFMARFWVAWAVGTILAYMTLRSRKSETFWDERAFALGTCAMSVSFAAAFWGLSGVAVLVVALSAGLADGWTEIVYASRIQVLPEPRRSQFFGLSATLEQSGFALGTVAAATALETLPAAGVVTSFHSVALLGSLVLLLISAIRWRATAHPQTPARALQIQSEDAHGTSTGNSALPRT